MAEINYFDDSHGPECTECGHYHNPADEGRCEYVFDEYKCPCGERWLGDKKGWA